MPVAQGKYSVMNLENPKRVLGKNSANKRIIKVDK